MSSVLVTGGGGFLGSHTAEHFARQGWTVSVGLRHVHPLPWLSTSVCPVACEVTSREAVAEALRVTRPDVVVHLAAQSLLSTSWADPENTLTTNLLGTLNILEALREAESKPLLIVAGTSAEYGLVAQATAPIPETARVDPWSPYGVSKAAALMLACTYARQYGLRIIWIRPFSIVGPRKYQDACSNFARGIVAIERGQAADLPVGDLKPVRDFLDVLDATTALERLVAADSPAGAVEVYNICSGIGRSIADLLDGLLSLARLPIRVRIDPGRFRPADQRFMIGDNTKLCTLGWTPRVPFETSLHTILHYWRSLD